MAKLAITFGAVVLAIAASSGVAASTGFNPTLHVDKGSIMTSDGGDFSSAQTGKLLAETDRVMVTEGGQVTLVYDNGCKVTYSKPGVYPVQPSCTIAGAVANAEGGVDVNGAGIVTGVFAAGLLIGKLTEGDSPAVSR